MKHSLPTVTVVTLVYNTGSFVVRGLASVKNQNYPQELIQHIIIDDASQDDSVQRIDSWIRENDYPCIFIKRDKNRGICAGLNEALDLAEGKYFIGLPDDLWKAEKLAVEIPLFEALSDDYALIYTNVDFCDEEDRVYETNVKHGDSGIEGNAFEHLLRTKTFIFGPAAIYRTEALRSVGGYDATLKFEDYDMLLRLANRFKFKYIDHSLTLYRHYTSRKSLANTVQEKAVDQLEFIKSMVKFLGQHEATDRIILSKIYKKHSYYQIKNGRSPLLPDELLHEPDMRDRELLDYFKQKRDFKGYRIYLNGMVSDGNQRRLSKRDYYYLLRKYFTPD